jgi:hypothetical protein
MTFFIENFFALIVIQMPHHFLPLLKGFELQLSGFWGDDDTTTPHVTPNLTPF